MTFPHFGFFVWRLRACLKIPRFAVFAKKVGWHSSLSGDGEKDLRPAKADRPTEWARGSQREMTETTILGRENLLWAPDSWRAWEANPTAVFDGRATTPDDLFREN